MSEKVSVIMGVFNCASTLPEAIESIINQTYSNWELIICDDASTDDTYLIAEQYRARYPEKIVLLQNKKNSRLAYSLNRCLKCATGKYIARMDGDDRSTPDRFMKQVAYLVANPDVHLVGTAMQRFSEKGVANIDYKPQYPDRYSLRNYIPYNHATIMTYKSVYDAVGGYTVSERTKRAQDYDLWFKFYYKNFRGDNLQEALYWVREDENAIKRRTFKVRWNAFKTTRYGYKLLGYPKYWLVKPAVKMIVKSLIPVSAMLRYREYQKKYQKKM